MSFIELIDMFHMERHSRNRLIIIVVIIISDKYTRCHTFVNKSGNSFPSSEGREWINCTERGLGQ